MKARLDVRDMERDGEHMWLRQSVTFSVDGQQRTLEIGIPLRTGAAPDEIEALLAEADAGMEHISRHLEARVSRLVGVSEAASPLAAKSAPAAAHSASAAELALPAAHDVTPPVTTPAPTPAAMPATPTPARTIAERPTAASPAPARPAAAPERTPATPPAARAAASDTGAPLALKDFLAAVQAEQGLNPKQVMEKLGVKSLAGLNLREALEMLRRQALRDGAEPAHAEEPAPAPAPATAPTAPVSPTTSEASYRFEEEDDAADIILTEDDEPAVEASEYGAEPPDDDDYDDLDEVPDFGSPAAEPEPVTASAPAAPAASVPAASVPAAPAADTSRAARILTHMRGMRGGGAVSAQQRNAYKNIVVAELGEPKAKALIASIWATTPEKLGPEQFDALNNWGKRETFGADTELVLAAVKAERDRDHERAAAESGGEPSVSPERTTSTRAAPRRASRATPTGGV